MKEELKDYIVTVRTTIVVEQEIHMVAEKRRYAKWHAIMSAIGRVCVPGEHPGGKLVKIGWCKVCKVKEIELN